MDRIIKFRGFNTKSKMMTYGFCINPRTLADKEWKIMQFTGLIDKNGKEIYESDLLITSNRSLAKKGVIMAVKYSGSGFVIYNPDCCDCCRYRDGCINSLDYYKNSDYEVIGNLYQDAKLLQKEQ